MTLLWSLTGASLVLAFVAWRRARRTAARLDELTQQYWELRYQHGELRVQVQRLTGAAPASDMSVAPESPAAPSIDGFVPLTSVKR